MAPSQYDLGVLTCCAVLVAVQLLMLGRRLLGELRPMRARLSRLAAHCASGWRRQEVDPDPFEQCVMKRARFHDSQNAVIMTTLLSAAFCGVLVSIMIKICMGRRRWFTPMNDIMALAANVAVTAVLASCRRYSQSRWLPLLHGSLTAMLQGFLQGVRGYEEFIFTARAVFPCRIILGWAMPRVGWAILCNGAHALLVICRLSYYPAAPADGPQSKFNMVQQELGEAALMVAFTVSVARTIAARARHEVQETTLRGETSAMLKLLNLVCDVVLELDADLRIMEHVPKFVATLALAPGKSTKGVHLVDFMPYEEDRERFQSHLRTNEDGSRSAGALHVRLRDSTVGDVSMEAFFVQFAGLDDQPHYFVGLREFHDPPPSELRAFGRTVSPRSGPAARRPSAAEQHDSSAGPTSGSLLRLPGGQAAAPCGGGGGAACRARGEAVARTPSTTSGPEQLASGEASASLGAVPCHAGKAMQCVGGSASAGGRAAAPCGGGGDGTAEEEGSESQLGSQLSSQTSSLASSTDCISDGLAGMRFAPTSQMGKDASILKAMLTWVLPPDPYCCAFHGAVADVRRVVERLEKYGCRAASSAAVRSQCGRCGVSIASRTVACDACGLRAPEPVVHVLAL